MTPEELIEWGRKESKLRGDELATVKSKEELTKVQNNAAKRRKAVHLTIGQAFKAVHDANIAIERGLSNEATVRYLRK